MSPLSVHHKASNGQCFAHAFVVFPLFLLAVIGECCDPINPNVVTSLLVTACWV